jgi:SAM-dependent methyltransferase
MPAMDGAQKMTVLTAMNYSAAAEGYAAFWSPVILPPARQMLQALPWDGTRRILDIGTGTGALIPEIRRLAPIASVMGIDPSLGMLARARGTHAPLAAMDAMASGSGRTHSMWPCWRSSSSTYPIRWPGWPRCDVCCGGAEPSA